MEKNYKIIYKITKEQLKQMLNLDIQGYKASDIASYKTCLSWYKKNSDIYIVILLNDKLIGYINFMPLKKETFEKFQKGSLIDVELTSDDIEKFEANHSYDCLFLSIIIEEKYRDSEAVILLTNGLKDKIAMLENKNIKINKIIIDCVSADGLKYAKRNGFSIFLKTSRNSFLGEFYPKNLLEIFHTIKTTEFEGVEFDEIIEDLNTFTMMTKLTNDLYFNYITIKNIINEEQVLKDFLSAAKYLIQHNKLPILNIPLINNYNKLVNSLIEKKYFKQIETEKILTFINENFLDKTIIVDEKIKFEKALNPKKFAKAIYKNFNFNVEKDDLYGKISKKYIPGIINSFKNREGITQLNYQAVKGYKIISTLTIIMDNSNKIAGITNASTHYKYRRKGINSKLIQMAINDIKLLGAKIIFADTEEGNASEKSFCKCGFEPCFKISILQPLNINFELLK